MNYYRYLLAGGLLLGAAFPAYAESGTDVCSDGGKLHVASPEWRDQIIYFLMLDRFADGDPSNNDQGTGEYNPMDSSRYSGGDIKGVTDRLDYIQNLGATTIWTTPPVANQWWSKESGYGGYHGYWARDFTKIDEHNGTMQDYQQLSCALHKRGMFLTMDIVVNHVGDFFNYSQNPDAADPAKGYRPANPASPSDAPLSYPFNLNDPRRAEDRKAGIYNWTKDLTNYRDRQAELTEQLAKLDDINTKSPIVRNAFKNIFGDWIANAGVDAFRVDTVKYVEPEFFEDFLYAPDGILKRAEKTGRNDFFVFGEVKENAPAFSILGEAKMQEYFSSSSRAAFPSLINFPLQEEMIRVLGQGMPTSALSYRLEAFMRTNPDPTLATNFVDNHDMPRFLSQGSQAAFKQALALIFTLPGIPMIYQGDEQAISDSRAAMFKGGYGADRDRYDSSSEIYLFIQELASLRKQYPALSRGKLTLLADNAHLAGAFAFRRDWEGETIFVIINSADHPSLLSAMPTGLDQGAILKNLMGQAEQHSISDDGSLTLELAPREIKIFSAAKIEAGKNSSDAISPAITIETPLPQAAISAPYPVSGRWTGQDKSLKLVIDGDLDSAQEITVGQDGRWEAILDARDVGTFSHIAQIYAPQSGQVAKAIPYVSKRTDADWSAHFDDPAFDDKGPDGSYRAPTDPGFNGQQDIIGANIRRGGDILEIELKMRHTSSDWHPSNGFDHVAITSFFDIPGQKGLPQSDDIAAPMPAGFSWSAMHTIFGWGNSMKLQSGRKIGRAPSVIADHEAKTITISYRASSLGLKSWQGVRLYITTFDREGEGGFRRMTKAGGRMEFGGDPKGPRIMDDLRIEIR